MVSVDVMHHVYRTFRAKERSRAGRWSWVLKERWIIICGSRRDQELDPQESPGEIKSREVELGSQKVGQFFASFVPQLLLFGHCDFAPHSC